MVVLHAATGGRMWQKGYQFETWPREKRKEERGPVGGWRAVGGQRGDSWYSRLLSKGDWLPLAVGGEAKREVG